MPLDLDFEQAFIRVTEEAAIAAAKTVGFGDGKHADHVAVEAMRSELDRVPMAGRIVIGEGERDRAPMLYVGEELGAHKGNDEALGVDIAVDPLEGTNLCATGAPGAIAVLAAAERGGLLHAPDIYMDKIVVGPTARDAQIHLDAPVAENLRQIADAYERDVDELTVVVLERDRHRQLIADIREAGARILLIGDGDLSAGIEAAIRGSGVHAAMGIGGAPEGVVTAAAMRCLGGEIYARLTPLDEHQRGRLDELGIDDVDRLYTSRDLAPGKQILFCATGVTGSKLLRGVRFFGGGFRTSTLFMSLTQQTIRFVDTIHREDLGTPVLFK